MGYELAESSIHTLTSGRLFMNNLNIYIHLSITHLILRDCKHYTNTYIIHISVVN